MPAQRAVVIGIDSYPGVPGATLDGCVNDARAVRAMLLETFGFPEENISLLLDEEAHRDGILDAWARLLGETGEDDIVVLHFSGHGSWVSSTDSGKLDRRDETLMPSDTGRGPGSVNQDIRDDEVQLFLMDLSRKTRNITLIFDCCHSGGITRSAGGAKSRGTPGTAPGEPEPPPLDPAARARLEAAWKQGGPSGWLPLSEHYVLIAGCRGSEKAWEYESPDGVPHGALTYHLVRGLREANAGATVRDVFERVACEVRTLGRQHPQAEGTMDRELFGPRDFEAGRFIRVESREGDTVVLAGGAAHGLSVGSVWSVLPPGGRSDSIAVGQVAIVSVSSVHAEARVLEEELDTPIGPTCRAVESRHSYGELRLRVWLARTDGEEPEEWQSLRAALLVSPLLRIVENQAEAGASVFLVEPRAQPDDQLFPELGPLDTPTLVAVAPDGEVRMPPKPLGDYGDVVANLETAARFGNALALENPGASADLASGVSVDLLRRRPDGEWVVAQAESGGGLPVIGVGDGVALRVTNNSGRDLWINVFDFDPGGAVTLLHPPLNGEERVVAGSHVLPRGNYWTLAFAGFPWENNPFFPAPESAVESFKCLFTTEPADFHFLEQGGFRAAGSPLELLAQTAFRGAPATRAASLAIEPVSSDWCAVTKSFVLTARGATEPVSAGDTPVPLGSAWISTGAAVAGRSWGMESERARVEQLEEPPLTGALRSAHMRTASTTELEIEGGPDVEAGVVLDVEDPGSAFGQVMLAANEGGVLTWHFPEPDAPPPPPGARGEAFSRFVIPGRVPPLADGPHARGLAGALGKRFVRHLVFPSQDEHGTLARDAIRIFETERRPYRIRTFTSDDYREEAQPGLIDDSGWERLQGGRCLLLIHGTNSRASTAFRGFPPDFVDDLHRVYQGRVFAFDHYTFSEDPGQNIDALIAMFPDRLDLDVDILCHSRGGLVSRVLTERQSEISSGSRSIRVGKVIFAGSPNAGTALADTRNVGHLLNVYTNLLSFFPDSGITDAIKALVCAVQTVAEDGASALPGLQSMVPEGDFLSGLKRGQPDGDTRYFGLASDFEPTDPALKSWVMEMLDEQVFHGARNDMVVPTDSVFGEPGDPPLAMNDRFSFVRSASVGHSGYFGSPNARDKIMEWLQAP